jgi:hypothetical protein
MGTGRFVQVAVGVGETWRTIVALDDIGDVWEYVPGKEQWFRLSPTRYRPEDDAQSTAAPRGAPLVGTRDLGLG